MIRHYSDYFGIRPDYAPVMTLADINKSPDTWLGFYPHESFVAILRDLLMTLDGRPVGTNLARTLWITGAYGTGKSHASLVLQKLFTDDDARVVKWLELREKQIPDKVREMLLARRKKKVLVAYDVNSDGVDAKNQFLMRLQRGIIKALSEYGYDIPLKGRLDEVIERVRQEREHFWAARDAMQEKLQHLNTGIKTADVLERKLRDETASASLASDVMKVFEARSIFLDLNAESFLEWVDAAQKKNGISGLVYVFDEFSSFMERNRAELKTLEQLAEASPQGRFFFIPVTHLEISSYLAEGSDSAKKANDRFAFKRLEMPNATALKLAADAFVVKAEMEDEWRKERDELWSAVRQLTENYMAANGASMMPTDFKDILPVHPMAAFLLKHLAVAVGSNQRSMFGFLNGGEFREFSAQGGLDVYGKQFLTVDHLWTYFVEREDLGKDKHQQEVRTEFLRREKELQPEEKRVFKAVLLFGLVEAMQGADSPLLNVSVENICRCFDGDGELTTGVKDVLKNLEAKHCFSIINGRCERFHDRADTADIAKKKETLTGKFDELVLADTQSEIEKKIKGVVNVGGRFVVRATSVDAFSSSKITNRDTFSDKGNRILIQFILAKDSREQLRIPAKARDTLQQFKDHRMLFIVLPETSFCRDNAKAWDEFIDNIARQAIANDAAGKKVFEAQISTMRWTWNNMVQTAAKLVLYKPNEHGEPFTEETTWVMLGKKLTEYAKQAFDDYTDDLSGCNISAFGVPSGLQNWALAGMRFDAFDKTGPWKTVIATYQKAGICGEDTWFENNPNHPLTKLRDKCKKWQDNTVGAGGSCSIRKLYIDLQRPPFGLLCVPHSAFVLGFALKDWLTGQRKLQWTDGVRSMALDAQTLAEIIEGVVKMTVRATSRMKNSSVDFPKKKKDLLSRVAWCLAFILMQTGR